MVSTLIRNPKTGRYVQRTGVIGCKILKARSEKRSRTLRAKKCAASRAYCARKSRVCRPKSYKKCSTPYYDYVSVSDVYGL